MPHVCTQTEALGRVSGTEDAIDQFGLKPLKCHTHGGEQRFCSQSLYSRH